MLRIGLDLDGVITDFHNHFLDYLNLPKHRVTGWDDKRFVDNFHLIDHDKEFWKTLPRLFDPEELIFTPTLYCTARNIATEISEYNLFDFNKMPLAPVYTVGRNRSKVETLKGRVDIFLDDHVKNFEELNEAGVTTFLITREHNEYYNAPKGMRFDSLLDFQDKFISIIEDKISISKHEEVQEFVGKIGGKIL